MLSWATSANSGAAHLLGNALLSQRARVVFDTLLPDGAHPTLPYGALEAGFDAFWSDFERTTLPAMHRPFRVALAAATWVAPLLIGRRPPLARHDRDTRERALAAMGTSRWYLWRQLLMVLKMTASLCYGADPAVREAIGYPAQPVDPGGKAAG